MEPLNIVPLKDNENLYAKYNLLNNKGEIKNVNPNSIKVRKWVKTLNLSPYYRFVIRQTVEGNSKIFIKA